MILYPPAKINLGLNILAKRPDGYHEIETIISEIPVFDILEITQSQQDVFIQSGLILPKDEQPNLCQRAISLLRDLVDFPKVHIHLLKQIPVGAGLGGGSSDASYTLKGLNSIFGLGLTINQLENLAAKLGSDCPFFIQGGTQFAFGRGEQLQLLPKLNQKVQLVVCNPNIHLSTKNAYALVKIQGNTNNLPEAMAKKRYEKLTNDFEAPIFNLHPSIEIIKNQLIELGAVHASLSGSGSSVYGIFEEDQKINIPSEFERYVVYNGAWQL